MEQKSYKLDIVNELLNSGNHIRGLAKRLGTNHMTVLRKMKELAKENVVDYKEEGKNKKYFLKGTIEAKGYVFSSESYKLNNALRKYPYLRVIVEKIQRDNRIKLAVLFGSYAKGTANPSSDIDVYIETADKRIKEEVCLVNSKLSVKIGRYDRSSLLAREIEKNHVIIKGVERYYEKTKFFG